LGQITLDDLFNQLSREQVSWPHVIQTKIPPGAYVLTCLHLSYRCLMRGFSFFIWLWVDQRDILLLFCIMFCSFQFLSLE